MARKPSIEVTVSPDVYAYLKQPEINASGLVEAAVRDKVSEVAIEQAARAAGVDLDDAEPVNGGNDDE